MMKICYRLAGLMMALLLTMMPMQSLADSEVVFVHEFDRAEGDYTRNVCSDGEGGFYALSQDKLMRWRPGYEQMDVIGQNGDWKMTDIACRRDQVYGISMEDFLYQLEDGEWLPLGKPDWVDLPAKKDSPSYMDSVLALGKDRLFFTARDIDQETHILCSYHLDSGEFSHETSAKFSQSVFLYDEADDVLIGSVTDANGINHYLVRYDYHTETILQRDSQPFSFTIKGYDSARNRFMFSGYWGAMLGLNNQDMMKIPGTPMRNSAVALLDDGYMVYALEQRDDDNARIVVLRYDPDRLEKVD